MYKLLVTGGLGFIGSNFILKSLDNNFKILNLDCNKYGDPYELNKMFLKNKNYEFDNFNLSILNNNLEKIIKRFDPDFIFHFAAESHVDTSLANPKSHVNSNILSTYNILESSKNIKSLKKFFYVSTDEVFGHLKKNDKPFTEKSTLLPRSPYSATKASGEMLCYAYINSFKLPGIITNCTNNFGPYQQKDKLIPKIITNLKKNKKTGIYGKGNNIRSWIHVDKHVDILINNIKSFEINERYLIGDKYNQITNINLFKLIFNYMKENKYTLIKEFNKSYKLIKDRAGHDYRYAVNTFKLEKLIQNKIEFNFKKNLFDTIEWYIKNE